MESSLLLVGKKDRGAPSSYQCQRDEQINSLCSFQNERAFFVEKIFYGWRLNAENRSQRRLFCSSINKMFPKGCRISVERQSFLNQPSVLIRTLRKLFGRLVSSTAAILPAPLQYQDQQHQQIQEMHSKGSTEQKITLSKGD